MHILHILHIEYFVSAMDGDQLVDFYWIDPMLTAERIAAKTKYAGHQYLQFEMEDSWERHGMRAFGRVNGGLVFEAAYIHTLVFVVTKQVTKQVSQCSVFSTLISHI